MLHKQFSSRAVFKFVFAIGGFFNIIFLFLVGLLTILPSLGAFSVIPNNTLPVKCNHQLAALMTGSAGYYLYIY